MMRACSKVAVLLAAAALPSGVAMAQTGFNGVITFQSDRNGGKQETFVQTTKGHKVRIEGFGSDSGSMIVDNDAKSMMMVEPSKKQYMLVTQQDMQQMQAMMGPMMERMKQGHDAKQGSFNFTKTGKSEKVAGVSCDVYHGTYVDEEGNKNEGEACVATGVGFALADIMANNPLLQQHGPGHDMMDQYRQLVGGNKGILKATSIKDGKATTELEATKIEPKDVSDTVFAPPKGYKEIRMADMMMQAHGAMQRMQQGQAGKPQR
ncbi:MAG: DUF4412 domain-containing protein [Gemmatimonadales bacterium]